jgi:hypothetical protein
MSMTNAKSVAFFCLEKGGVSTGTIAWFALADAQVDKAFALPQQRASVNLSQLVARLRMSGA